MRQLTRSHEIDLVIRILKPHQRVRKQTNEKQSQETNYTKNESSKPSQSPPSSHNCMLWPTQTKNTKQNNWPPEKKKKKKKTLTLMVTPGWFFRILVIVAPANKCNDWPLTRCYACNGNSVFTWYMLERTGGDVAVSIVVGRISKLMSVIFVQSSFCCAINGFGVVE